MGAHYINVAPRYTCGSPASVDIKTAESVARDERDAYDYVLNGIEGEKSAERAKLDGLKLIVFEMVEVGKGWWVLDWLTNEMHWWPFEAECPQCKRKKVRCRRGYVEDHGCPFRVQAYVGRAANEDERRVHARRFIHNPLTEEGR